MNTVDHVTELEGILIHIGPYVVMIETIVWTVLLEGKIHQRAYEFSVLLIGHEITKSCCGTKTGNLRLEQELIEGPFSALNCAST